VGEPRIAVDDYTGGVIVGLVIGEGSFTGDESHASLVVAMHVRHTELLEWLQQQIPGSELYGPYHHDGRDSMRWRVRGRPLQRFMTTFEKDIADLCPHVAGRIARMWDRYGPTLHLAGARAFPDALRRDRRHD
jgi:hypothetical protein